MADSLSGNAASLANVSPQASEYSTMSSASTGAVDQARHMSHLTAGDLGGSDNVAMDIDIRNTTPGRLIGQLDVIVLQGRNVGQGGRECRPYCVVEFEKSEFVTRESYGNNPVWNHGASFDVTQNDSEFAITVWDRANKENGNNEEFLGSCTVRPARSEGKKQQVWFKLKGRQYKSIRGDICVQFVFTPKTYSQLSVDDFHLMRVVGKGSFGKVLQVRKKDTGRIYAMKILRKEKIVKRDEIQHTLSERNVLARMDSPFLVQLKFSFQTAPKLYLVIDYVNGGELFYHLSNAQAFSEPQARFYAAELLLALQHLHKCDIIYRDLKPENVLLDSNGHVALTDFGLCKEQSGPDDMAETFCGTAEYLAPEVLKGQGYGKAVDWWSLGILLYEMLTGLPPFFSENTNLMYKKILFSELTFPPEISPVARSLLHGLLTRDPEKRLGSGPDGAEEIKAHPFFVDIPFDRLAKKSVAAPFKPAVTSEFDASQVDEEFLREIPEDSVVDSTPLPDSVQEKFKGFTFHGHEDNGVAAAARSIRLSPNYAPESMQDASPVS